MLPDAMKQYRDFFARRVLKGSGIEIGAGAAPLEIDESVAKIQYVDYLSLEEIKQTYAHTPDSFREADVIDDCGGSDELRSARCATRNVAPTELGCAHALFGSLGGHAFRSTHAMVTRSRLS